MPTLSRVLILVFSCFSAFGAAAQSKTGADAFLTPAVDSYKKSIGENIPYNDGREFPGYGIKLDGHPFFRTDQLSYGDIVYEGTRYAEVPMLYDLVADEVVVQAPGSQYLIRLSRDKLPAFYYQGEEFFRADPDSSGQRYYQSIYKGNVRVFARKRKQLSHITTAERAIDRFDEYDDYFILREGEIVRVNGKSSVLKAFKDRRDDLKKMIVREDVSFKKDPEKFLKRCAAEYDQSRNK